MSSFTQVNKKKKNYLAKVVFRKSVSSVHLLRVTRPLVPEGKKKKVEQLEGNVSADVHARSQLSRAHRQRTRIARVIAIFTYSHRQVRNGKRSLRAMRLAKRWINTLKRITNFQRSVNVRFAILSPRNFSLYFEILKIYDIYIRKYISISVEIQ